MNLLLPTLRFLLRTIEGTMSAFFFLITTFFVVSSVAWFGLGLREAVGSIFLGRPFNLPLFLRFNGMALFCLILPCFIFGSIAKVEEWFERRQQAAR